MISIRDVAKLAEVSPSTVSRVINGSANVNFEKKQRVLKVIQETNFKPNEVARSLYKKSSKIIGIIMPNIENPFFNEIAKAIEAEAYKNGYRLTLCNSNDMLEKEIENIHMLRSMNADGIILMTNNEEIQTEIEQCKIPVILLDRQVHNYKEMAYIQANHYEGGKMATEYLLQCGCKNIVTLCGPQKLSSARERFQGYLDVCKQYEMKPNYIECAYSFHDGLKKAEILLKRYPKADGIFACNDMVAISVYRVLCGLGYKIPEDIQLIGYDNINLSWMFTPELTTIAQPIKEMGTEAAKIIIQHVEGKKIVKEHVYPVKLMKRKTTINKD